MLTTEELYNPPGKRHKNTVISLQFARVPLRFQRVEFSGSGLVLLRMLFYNIQQDVSLFFKQSKRLLSWYCVCTFTKSQPDVSWFRIARKRCQVNVGTQKTCAGLFNILSKKYTRHYVTWIQNLVLFISLQTQISDEHEKIEKMKK